MLKRLGHGQTCCLGELSTRNSFVEEKCANMTLKLSTNRMFFSFLMHFLYNFREISLEVPTRTKTKERALHYSFVEKRRSILLQKHFRKISTPSFCATCVLFETFWSQNVGKRSTKTELIFQKAF